MFLENVTTESFDFSSINWDSIWNGFINWCIHDGVKLILALVIWFISFKLINFIGRMFEKKILKKNVDKTIASVILSVSRKLIKVVILVSLMAYVGIETSGLTAILATFSLGIGLAVQGSLSNFAGGVLILLTRPFKLGDYIESGSLGGTVEVIDLFYTSLVTSDNRVIRIPNGSLANSSVINYSAKETRRLDIEFSISYEDDFKVAKEIITDCISTSGLALDDPKPFVNIICHNASSVDIVARIWVKKENYWPLKFMLLEDVKVAFDKGGITIPYPQVDVHQQVPPKN